MRIISAGSPGRLVREMRRRDTPKNRRIVESIIRDVARNGDAAVRKYERRFGAGSPRSLRVSRREIDAAYSRVSAEELSAVRLARSRLSRSERAVRRLLRDVTVRSGGARMSRSFVPIDSVGCYVPGGGARYPSSAVMSVVPAKIAGVRRIAVASPPDPSGRIDPLTLVAADLCGATEIYRTGGAQAIAALAHGTRSIKRVDKIVGPGGAFVTMAKHLVSDVASIDMLAGPTELCVIVDSEEDAELAALDLISQAEHSPDTLCYALATSAAVAKRIRSCVSSRLKTAERSGIARSSLESNGFIAVCRAADIAGIANELAPEHLEILGGNRGKWGRITGPGLVLSGRYSPSSAGDYLLGSNHILPTGGLGRSRGPLSVLDFVKMLSRVEARRDDLRRISGPMRALALAEGLPNHYEAVRGRLQ